MHDYAHPVPHWGMWLSSELLVTFSSLRLKSCDPVTIQNLRRTFALKGTKEEGHKRILLGASWNTVEHCHHQLEKIWHNSDTTKNWMSLRNWWNDEKKKKKNLLDEASKKQRSSMKGAAGIPGVMRRGLHTRDAIWQIRSTFAKRSGQILPSPDPPWEQTPTPKIERKILKCSNKRT